MMLNQTARPTPHVLCPKVELTKNNSIPVIPQLPSRSASSKERMRALLETLENASLPSNKSWRQHQQEES
jgi:hypothetical protein